MAWTGEKVELTEGQKRAAQFAGIPADRIGLGAEYPKAVYKEDESGVDRTLNNEPILVDGKYAVRTATVANEDEELEALEQGWFLTPNLKEEARKRDAIAEKDAEIAALKTALADKQPAKESAKA
jgi:hypothetical protein